MGEAEGLGMECDGWSLLCLFMGVDVRAEGAVDTCGLSLNGEEVFRSPSAYMTLWEYRY